MNDPITPTASAPAGQKGTSLCPCPLLPAPRVYMSGPISGRTYDLAKDWRDYARDRLAPDIVCYSPLRAHDHLKDEGELRGAYPQYPLTTSAALTARDRYDCLTCDLLLVDLTGACEVSIGTCVELGWADAFRKPIVLVMEPKNNVHDHPLVRSVCAFRTDVLEEGLQIVRGILLP